MKNPCLIIIIVTFFVVCFAYFAYIRFNKTSLSPLEIKCISDGATYCNSLPDINKTQRKKCRRQQRRGCLNSSNESYTTTSMIKTMMINKLPNGLSTSDNRSTFKEKCCGF